MNVACFRLQNSAKSTLYLWNFLPVAQYREMARTKKLNCQLFVVVLVMTFLEFCSSINGTTQSPQVARSLEDIGNPRTDIYSCGRNKSSYICDPDHVLSAAQGNTEIWIA